MKLFIKNNKGFTIMELLIYSVIVSMVLLAGTIFLLEVIKGENKARSIQEVQNNANYIIERITKTIRGAESIDTNQSIFDSHPGRLVLNMPVTQATPIVFQVDSENNAMIYQEGSSDEVTLSSSEVEISNLIFKNFSTGKNQRNIQIDLEVNYRNPNQLSDFNASFDIQQSVSIRK